MCLLVMPLNKAHKGIASTVSAHERQWSLTAYICRKLTVEQHAWASSTVFYRCNHTSGSREKDPICFLLPEQVTPAGELASHMSLSWRNGFETCESEKAERWGSLHGKSTLGKNAMIVLVNISTLSFAVLSSILGDLHLFYSFHPFYAWRN